jgi:hypothetical protein
LLWTLAKSVSSGLSFRAIETGFRNRIWLLEVGNETHKIFDEYHNISEEGYTTTPAKNRSTAIDNVCCNRLMSLLHRNNFGCVNALTGMQLKLQFRLEQKPHQELLVYMAIEQRL